MAEKNKKDDRKIQKYVKLTAILTFIETGRRLSEQLHYKTILLIIR